MKILKRREMKKPKNRNDKDYLSPAIPALTKTLLDNFKKIFKTTTGIPFLILTTFTDAWKRYNLSLGLGLNKVASKVFRIGHLGNLNELQLLGCLTGVQLTTSERMAEDIERLTRGIAGKRKNSESDGGCGGGSTVESIFIGCTNY